MTMTFTSVDQRRTSFDLVVKYFWSKGMIDSVWGGAGLYFAFMANSCPLRFSDSTYLCWFWLVYAKILQFLYLIDIFRWLLSFVFFVPGASFISDIQSIFYLYVRFFTFSGRVDWVFPSSVTWFSSISPRDGSRHCGYQTPEFKQVKNWEHW